MSDLTKRLCRPGYDLQKEQAIQEAIIEIRELRAKIEQMEQQEPVATVRINAINGNPSVDFVPGHHYLHHNDRLYLTPAQKEKKMMLFCDCKTDEEKSNFFLSGRAVETGVIAPAISNEVAMAYHRCAQLKKENDALRAKIEQREKQEPVGKIVAFGESLHEPSWRGGRLPPVMTELYALPGAKGE